jgi:hypothetical protein
MSITMIPFSAVLVLMLSIAWIQGYKVGFRRCAARVRVIIREVREVSNVR